MQHEDFLNEYRFIKNKEIHALNDALIKHFSGEYHFENHPYVVATYPNTDEPVKAKVMAVKAPISAESGILLQTAEIECDGDDYDFEVGYMGISFGDIDSILDLLPEPEKEYYFRWDGGDLPRRHERVKFTNDVEAREAARKFKKEHHIDILVVSEMEPCDDGLYASRNLGQVK